VDARIEFFALQTSFGSGGESVFSSLNTLTENLDDALGLWGDMLRNPAFDSAEVERWRGRELEGVRRRPDDPQRLAYTEFNRLMYGDHPVGWEMAPEDLTPDRVSTATLTAARNRIMCPEHLILGVTGDVSWDEMRPRLERLLDGWPACSEPLPDPPVPDIRKGGGVFVIPRELEQSVLVMAHATDVHLSADPEYFAAQIGNAILGSGGFSSRLLSRVRTEEGYAYSAASLWTTPRKVQGLLGAVTRTRPENAVPALRLILEIMDGMRSAPPTGDEVRTSVDQIVNGFVFNFESPAQIVSRRMAFLAQDLPEDWLEQYLAGVQDVTPASIRRVFRENLRPGDMTILVVGDPERMGWDALRSLGPVTVLEIGVTR
jgi:zinc protease